MTKRVTSLGTIAVALLLVLLAAAATAPVRAAGVLDEVREQFNEDRGVLRLVVLVSPTCPECVSGAGWIQDYILKRNPTVDLKVYAVWYEMYPGDSPSAFPAARKMMPDKRVRHYWDQRKDVGRWFYGLVPTNTTGNIEWDAFYLYGPDSVWTDTGQPTDLLTWGRTILTDRRRLLDRFADLTAGAAPSRSETIDGNTTGADSKIDAPGAQER
jgi:hypothetical protein